MRLRSSIKAVTVSLFAAGVVLGNGMALDNISARYGFSAMQQDSTPPQQSRPAHANTEQRLRQNRAAASQQPEGRKVVEFEADIMRPVTIEGDSTALSLVGNVIFYHNGAVILCDSAVRYSEKRMDCFNRVVVNQKNTFIYGDHAIYDGITNTASIYAPIIKVIDDDAVLYTYQFSFNTLDNIGRYGGGGTMTQGDNLMESKRGYYYADDREFIGVDSVEIQNPEYRLRSDSVAYNMDTEVARFFVKTYIWNEKGEILSADAGRYLHTSADYEFTENSYILTESQEIWADTLDYNSRTENAILRNNIQVRDDEQHTMAFGDFGQYWGEPQNGMMTLDPSVLSYDPEQPDTLYVRSDTMFVYTYPRTMVFETSKRGTQTISDGFDDEELMGLTVPGSDTSLMERPGREQLIPRMISDSIPLDSMGMPLLIPDDSLTGAYPGMVDSLAADTLPAQDLTETVVPAVRDKASIKAEQRAAKAEDRARRLREKRDLKQKRKAARRGNRDIPPDTIPSDTTLMDSLAGVADSLALAGLTDSLGLASDSLDFLAIERIILTDSLGNPVLDSLGNPIYAELPVQAATGDEDSLQRVFHGYRNVRIYRNDFQAVCDSMVGFSIDTTMHLYIDPVLWNGDNQITSDIIDIFTKDEQIDRAEFTGGDPFMVAQVDSVARQYNQIKGRFMVARFRDNAIYEHNVVGNGETFYYMQDDETKDVNGFMVVTSASIIFRIEEQQVDEIVFSEEPEYVMYPMDKIPGDQETFLSGFKWVSESRPRKKEDVFNREIRPSERVEYLLLPEPQFPLTDRIIKDRDRMIKNGIWRERNDQLSPEALDFIRYIETR